MKREVIFKKLNSLGTMVCRYEQSKSICTGVSMEWLRRVILKGKETLYSGDTPAEKVGKKEYTKEERWEMTQTGIYHSHAAAAFLHDHSTRGDNFDNTARKELVDLRYLKLDLKKAREATKGNLVPVSAVSDKIAQFARGYGMNPEKLSSDQLARLQKSADSGESSILFSAKNRAYDQWKGKEEFPIEMGVFKECTKDLENQCFDEKGIELRARFNGLKVVDGVNKLNLPTVKPLEAINAALKNSLFTVTRGLMFGVLFQDKPGHSNAVYHGQGGEGDRKFLFLDPNYGLWRMAKLEVIQAVTFLYGEKGPYQKNDGRIPRGFEYSIWEKREKT
jgi:hypothetical protein